MYLYIYRSIHLSVYIGYIYPSVFLVSIFCVTNTLVVDKWARVFLLFGLLRFNILQVDEAWRGDFFTHSASTVNGTPLPSLV
jgi:hypothetical protein